MAKQRRLNFGRWVPKDARQELKRQAELPGANCPLLERLASQEMKSGVWDRLPSKAEGQEGLIIAWTCGAADAAGKWSPKPSIGNPPAESAALRAEWLGLAIRNARPDASERWRALWPGDSNTSFETAISFVDQLTEFYRRLDAEIKQQWAAINFPHPRKKRGKNVRRGIVARLLSYRFQKNFGDPCDEAVAELVGAVFKYPKDGGLSAETVRGLRRFKPAG